MSATQPSPKILTFPDAAGAYGKAVRMARYGHRDWLVWKMPDKTYKVAKLGPVVLRQAVGECDKTEADRVLCTMVARDSGHYYYCGPNVVAAWLSNMDAGQYCY